MGDNANNIKAEKILSELDPEQGWFVEMLV